MSQTKIYDLIIICVHQWFSTSLNPASSIHAFIEPFVVAKIKSMSWILLLLLLKISCRRTPETDSPNPWGSIGPRLTHSCPPFQHLLSERRQSLGQQMLKRWAKIDCENATVGKNGLRTTGVLLLIHEGHR